MLRKPVIWVANRFSSKPDKKRIFSSLGKLVKTIRKKPGKKGIIIDTSLQSYKFIIFSDQHKGAKNGSDDFMLAEPNYLAALDYYFNQGFYLINLGDNEELWKNSIWKVLKNNEASIEKEKQFVTARRFTKIYGNHDLYWHNDPLAKFQLKKMYDEDMNVYEGIILKIVNDNHPYEIFCTHGHQGDLQSDGNWFSQFFVSKIWGPFQAFLKINPNTPANNDTLKTANNRIMYEWSSKQKNLLLITGHTHQPVFGSLTHLERLYRDLEMAKAKSDEKKITALKEEIQHVEKEYKTVSENFLQMNPTYFNTGCCCFNDGDITGIEVENGSIRLIKWEMQNRSPVRIILEENTLANIISQIK